MDKCLSPILFPSTSKVQYASRERTICLWVLFELVLADLEEDLRNVTRNEIGVTIGLFSLNGGGAAWPVLAQGRYLKQYKLLFF